MSSGRSCKIEGSISCATITEFGKPYVYGPSTSFCCCCVVTFWEDLSTLQKHLASVTRISGPSSCSSTSETLEVKFFIVVLD
jgi:hypothetical protein